MFSVLWVQCSCKLSEGGGWVKYKCSSFMITNSKLRFSLYVSTYFLFQANLQIAVNLQAMTLILWISQGLICRYKVVSSKTPKSFIKNEFRRWNQYASLNRVNLAGPLWGWLPAKQTTMFKGLKYNSTN